MGFACSLGIKLLGMEKMFSIPEPVYKGRLIFLQNHTQSWNKGTIFFHKIYLRNNLLFLVQNLCRYSSSLDLEHYSFTKFTLKHSLLFCKRFMSKYPRVLWFGSYHLIGFHRKTQFDQVRNFTSFAISPSQKTKSYPIMSSPTLAYHRL